MSEDQKEYEELGLPWRVEVDLLGSRRVRTQDGLIEMEHYEHLVKAANSYHTHVSLLREALEMMHEETPMPISQDDLVSRIEQEVGK